MPRALWRPYGGGLLLMSEVPLQGVAFVCDSCPAHESLSLSLALFFPPSLSFSLSFYLSLSLSFSLCVGWGVPSSVSNAGLV